MNPEITQSEIDAAAANLARCDTGQGAIFALSASRSEIGSKSRT